MSSKKEPYPEDDTARLKQEQQQKIILEKINKYLSAKDKVSEKILDSMSHELRTPTVTIKAYTEMLLEGKFGDLTPEQKEKLERIKTNTNMLVEAILKLLQEKTKENLTSKIVGG